MYKILTTLLLLVTTVCYGQGYKVCKVYYEDSQSPERNGLEKEQHFNEFGKITYEKKYGNRTKNEDYHDTTYHIYRKYFTYAKNKLLLSTITYWIDYYKREELDTFKEFYYYNDKRMLLERHETWYGKHMFQRSCFREDIRRWGDTNVTHYHYDDRGNITYLNYSNKSSKRTEFDIAPILMLDSIVLRFRKEMKDQYNMDFIKSIDTYIYDGKNQLLFEINYYNDFDIDKTEYVYLPTGYLEISSSNNLPQHSDTTHVLHTLNKRGQITEEVHKSTFINITINTRKMYGYFPDKRLLKEIVSHLHTNKNDTEADYTITHLYTYE